jgi:hypothetical protein
MHSAGKRILISAGGATDTPTSASYFTSHEPVALAKTIANAIKAAGVDGVDLDWEDDWSNSNPGLTGYGAAATRRVGGGPAVQWLITLTKELRKHLPRPRYTITHAPQAPYFDIGYAAVYAGRSIYVCRSACRSASSRVPSRVCRRSPCLRVVFTRHVMQAAGRTSTGLTYR